MENKKQITRTYLQELVNQGLLKSEIHLQIIKDYNIKEGHWRISDTTNLFKIANISLRSKPRKKKVQFEIIEQ